MKLKVLPGGNCKPMEEGDIILLEIKMCISKDIFERMGRLISGVLLFQIEIVFRYPFLIVFGSPVGIDKQLVRLFYFYKPAGSCRILRLIRMPKNTSRYSWVRNTSEEDTTIL